MPLLIDFTSEEERIEHFALNIAPDSTISFPITASPSSWLEAFKEIQTVKLPTYKDEFLTEGRGFHHEKGRGPKPLGAMWMHLKAYKRTKNGKQVCWVEPEFHSAN